MENKSILLIGGSGIISSEVCNLAIQKGYNVTILNRGRRKSKINPQARLIVSDIKKETVEDIKAKLKNEMFDIVVDFVSYDLTQLKKMLTIVNCYQYIFTSTATVYSPKDTNERYNETDEKENSVWDYCVKKRECEKYLEAEYAGKQDFHYTIVRPYVTYNETRFPFQIAPLEYYTIIYRILNNLPIVICGSDTYCTVTTSKEYAVGLVGLFFNKKAYNQDFHITTDNITTWKHIVEITAEKLNKKINLIDIPKEFLVNYKNSEIAIAEIIGDKGRNMSFNNKKIKEAVSEFKAESDFDSNIDDILNYFKQSTNKNVNYLWCGSLDRLIYKYSKQNRDNETIKIMYTGLSVKQKLLYRIGRSNVLYSIYNTLKLIKRVLKGSNK